MSVNILKQIGYSLYNMNVLKERKRYIIFRMRCQLHKKQIGELLAFFAATPLRERLLAQNPSFVEQTTRRFFYKNSTYSERIDIVKNHITHLERVLQESVLEKLYVEGEKLKIWEEPYGLGGGDSLAMELFFGDGERKEGCLSLNLMIDNGKGEQHRLYRIIFWLSPSLRNAEPSLWIGALQGSPEASETIKDLTKAFFGYRTKNLIFYGIRNVAKILLCRHIYAVTNSGYYAMNGVRIDRKLKTSLDEFWEECEGQVCADKRFYEIPIEECRKSIDELKSQKRAQYKRRFAKLDEITTAIEKNLEVCTKHA